MARTYATHSRSLALFVISLGLGLAFHWFFYAKLPGISTSIFVALVALALFLTTRAWGVRVPRNAWMALLGAVFFAAWVAVRTSPLLTVLNIVFALYLVGMAVLLTAKQFDWGNIVSFIRIPFLPIFFVGKIPWSVARMTEFRGKEEGTGTTAEVVRGVLMALPVLFLFMLLFASADLVIREYLLNIFNIGNLEDAIGRTITVLAFALFAAGTLGYAIVGKGEARMGGAAEKRQGKLSALQTSVFLGAIAVLFLGFILVQAAYLFGGEATLSGRDFTYAEYARHGFFELLAVAIITFLLLWGSERAVAREARGSTPLTVNHSRQFKIIAIALVAEVILIIASAFMRLSLYESAFGFTTLRLWSHAFTILLMVFFLLFALKIARDADDKLFLVPAFFVAALTLLVMNLLNPDVFIARKNIERFMGQEQFDAGHIVELADDAVEQKLAVLDGLEGEDKEMFGQMLAYRYDQRRNAKEDDSWQSWNVARRRAESLLGARAAELRQYK